ncbi:MAG: DUF86 domain-containing protein [Bacteroides sp.]|jgi:toxin-antitoxin system antitoxin component|uniref:HepT-like ribonuclease domain-containing protein n=1 Tax=Bacteroides TaxID=816 RepID=UPI0025B924D5|nr:HepT-like ribonuclease domain-containing protein [Bacteroides sp.]MBS6239138.1 DUF86 domain-containing protein [Bacteroides sp.]
MQYSSKENVIECLTIIIEKSNLVIERNEKITSFHDFLSSSTNMEKFDAACMLIQVIGETARKIDDWTVSKLFSNYPQVYWKGVFALRNIISHEYGNVDPENIFKIIKIHLPELIACVKTILKDMETCKYNNLFVEK